MARQSPRSSAAMPSLPPKSAARQRQTGASQDLPWPKRARARCVADDVFRAARALLLPVLLVVATWHTPSRPRRLRVAYVRVSRRGAFESLSSLSGVAAAAASRHTLPRQPRALSPAARQPPAASSHGRPGGPRAATPRRPAAGLLRARHCSQVRVHPRPSVRRVRSQAARGRRRWCRLHHLLAAVHQRAGAAEGARGATGEPCTVGHG